MKKFFITLLSIVSLFISCSNLVEDSTIDFTDESSTFYTVKGSLSSKIDYSAVPRSAFPSNDVNLSLYTTNIYYKTSPTATERTLCGTTTGNLFELKLPSLGTYYLEAESYNTLGVSHIIDFKTIKPVEITLTEDAPYKNDVSLFLHLIVEEGGSGSIDLYFKSFDTTKVKRFDVYEGGIKVDSKDLSTTSTKWNNNNIQIDSGAHNYVFNFYNAAGALVYQCNETITVFPNKTTDTWVDNGNAEYFSTETIGGKATVVMNITQDCLDNFALTNFYVESSGDDSGNGSYFAPVKTLKAAVDKCIDDTKNYTINIMGDVNVDSGSVVSNNITIQKAPGVTSAKLVYKSTTNSLFQVSESNTLKISNIDIVGPDKTSSQAGGAAIYNRGTLILNNVNLSKFKNDDGTGQGGCLYNAETGTIFITGGSITSCESNQGGAIYNAGEDIEIEDCTISSCTAQRGGAIYNDTATKIKLSGNTSITSCTAAESGGGIFLYSRAKVYMQDSASIKNCTAPETSGSGIYASGTECRVDMKDSAYLDSASDIYLNTGASVTLNGNLTPPEAARGIAATITPKTYTGGIQILDENTIGLIADNYLKFALTSTDEDPSIQWTIDNTGKLKKEVLVSRLTAAPTDTNAVYKLSTVADLSKIAGWVNGGSALENIRIKLTSDITIPSDYVSIGSCTDTVANGNYRDSSNKPFKGIFDGNNKTITFESSSNALFGYAESAEISNIKTKGTFTANTSKSGTVVNYLKGGRLSNCVNNATITTSQDYVGGIIGVAEFLSADRSCVIENCINYGNISSTSDGVGGIIGYTRSVKVINCYNTGNITGTYAVGGIAGWSTGNNSQSPYGTVGSLYENCGNSGEIKATTPSTDRSQKCGAGGIAGGNTSGNANWKPDFINCWSSGQIIASSNLNGGIFGTTEYRSFTNCTYMTGTAYGYGPSGASASGTDSDNSVSSNNESLKTKLNDYISSNNKTDYKTWAVKNGKVVFSDMD